MIYYIVWDLYIGPSDIRFFMSFKNHCQYIKSRKVDIKSAIRSIIRNSNDVVSKLVSISLHIYNIFANGLLYQDYMENDERNYDKIIYIISQNIPKYGERLSFLKTHEESISTIKKYMNDINVLKITKFTFDKYRCLQDNPHDMNTNPEKRVKSRRSLRNTIRTPLNINTNTDFSIEQSPQSVLYTPMTITQGNVPSITPTGTQISIFPNRTIIGNEYLNKQPRINSTRKIARNVWGEPIRGGSYE
jgi:hypothetical protein